MKGEGLEGVRLTMTVITVRLMATSLGIHEGINLEEEGINLE
jgi:hypothetical protein